ncbi:hypothetical protein ACHHYP_02381 [Achlya hypogyna]|uniref:Purple acid phosphatase n=1 Tax=Achlya hypogyna TaxID=1202772 RepID=A0A0A7CN21_ACHHY|nr:secreted protein [Achlya hypogyna]OQR93630.1 hypothetical protein ACHHYP_02381 [Achlya hypogyna]
MLHALVSMLVAAAAVAATVDQVHLGLTTANVNCPEGVSVVFASTTGVPMAVAYAAPGSPSATTTTTVASYNVSSALYNYSSPFLHTARLCKLQASTKYTYSVGAATGACGAEFDGSFMTPPATGTDNTPTVLGIVGDIGSEHITDTLQNTAAGMNGIAAHAIFLVGDLAYANGQHEQWDTWYHQAQSVFASVPSLGINGNHETVKGGGTTKPKDKKKYLPENYLGYIHRINNPVTAAQNDKLRTYYSIDIGLVHAVFLDDYSGYRGDEKSVVGSAAWLAERSAQLAWLDQDLAAVNRQKTPWVLVLKHNPFYNSWNTHQCKCSATRFEITDPESCWKGKYDASSDKDATSQPHCANQAKFEDIYLKYSVNFVVAGHVHAYERTAPIAKNKIDSKNGVVYMTTGAGGHGNDCTRLGSVPNWSVAASSAAYGATRVVATRDALDVYWVANVNNTVLDTFTLTKDGIVHSVPSVALAAFDSDVTCDADD